MLQDFSLYHQIIVLPVAEPERLVNLGAPGHKWGSRRDFGTNMAGGARGAWSGDVQATR